MELNLSESWRLLLKDEIEKTYFLDLIRFLDQEYTKKPDAVFPEKKKLFAALNACPLDKISVVILGQDPYPTKGFAHGLCFSVQKRVKIPKSLNNIFKELQTDVNKNIPEHGNLQEWADQGVLLLNTILSVEEGAPLSHQNKGWEQFTDAVLKLINQKCQNVVYLLWGNNAIQKEKLFDVEHNLILKSPHPSPLSAHRGFFGCKHFSSTNQYLQLHGKPSINW